MGWNKVLLLLLLQLNSSTNSYHSGLSRLAEVVRIEIFVLSYKDLEVGRPQLMWTLSSAPIWEIGTEKRLVECYCYYCIYNIIVVVVAVVVDDDTYYRVYLSSDHPFQVYYQVRQVWLQSATAYLITKCYGLLLQSATSVMTKCDRYYKVRQNRCWIVRNVQNLRHFFLALHHQAAFYHFSCRRKWFLKV